jgi:hypothetical protein
MLSSRAIPQYYDEDEPADWPGFLTKAARGSIKAEDWFQEAGLAYMVALTGDPTAPDTLDLEEYARLFRQSFPPSPPETTFEGLMQLAVAAQWFPRPVASSEQPCRRDEDYAALWKRKRSVSEMELAHDALLHCRQQWSADDCLRCLEETSADYNSRTIVSGMLYLSFTWPEKSSL